MGKKKERKSDGELTESVQQMIETPFLLMLIYSLLAKSYATPAMFMVIV
jgi:hypothetical protein